jgi:tetratricopeptide (TPR) repeat protein
MFDDFSDDRNTTMEEAVTAYEKILKADAKDYDAHFQLGLLYFELDREKESLSELKTAGDLYPDRHEPWLIIGTIHLQKNRIDEATEDYEKAVKAAPDVSYNHHGLALTYLRAGRYGEATEAFKRAVYFFPQDMDAMFRLKYISRLIQRPDEELRAAREATSKDPGDPVAHHWLGVLLMLMGILEGCVDELRKAVNLDPDNADYHFDLASVLYFIGNEEAIDELKEVLLLKPKRLDAMILLGDIYYDYDMIDDSIRMFKKAMKAAPDNDLPHYYLGSIYGGKSMSREARKELKRALKLNPENFAALKMLANSYANDGLYDEAIGQYKIMAKLEPGINSIRKSIEKLNP